MKHLILSLLTGLPSLVFASEGFVADYVVPTPPELVEYSRFQVQIKSAYKGRDTDKIVYTFPEDLTGITDGTVTLKKVSEVSDLWVGDEMEAVCTTNQSFFSCNMYLIKEQDQQAFQITRSSLKIFDKQRALDVLRSKDFAQDVFDKKSRVLDHFHSGEPAGILSYQFMDY